VVIEYETFNSRTGKVEVHVASSSDQGATIDTDVVIYSFTPLSLLAATGSASDNREFGDYVFIDYVFITSVGNTFFGVFSGLGDVNSGGINTTGLIDPFLITGSSSGLIVPEPASLSVLLGGVAGLGWLRRRRVCT
jgi:hypothetical protein